MSYLISLLLELHDSHDAWPRHPTLRAGCYLQQSWFFKKPSWTCITNSTTIQHLQAPTCFRHHKTPVLQFSRLCTLEAKTSFPYPMEPKCRCVQPSFVPQPALSQTTSLYCRLFCYLKGTYCFIRINTELGKQIQLPAFCLPQIPRER